jgi:ADP-ribosylglycohydrolase
MNDFHLKNVLKEGVVKLGAIIGDITGSRFEWHSIKTKEFELFTSECFFTDDTVMTVVIAQAILSTARGGYENFG